MKDTKDNVKTETFGERYGLDIHTFFAMVKMLLAENYKIDFKAKKKNGILKIVSWVVIFSVLTLLSAVFFFVAVKLNIFSIFPFVPETVPSIIVNLVFFFGFIPLTITLLKSLYYADDSSIVSAFPINPVTIISARLFFVYLKQLLMTFFVEIPFLLGYIIFFSFPAFSFVQLVLSTLLLVFLEVSVCTLLSVPLYFIANIFRRHRIFSGICLFVLLLALVLLAVYLFSLIPDHIDIFTNWGPYFNQIQLFLTAYQKDFSFLFYLTGYQIGVYNGTTIIFFNQKVVSVFTSLLSIAFGCYIVSILFLTPFYKKMVGRQLRPKASKIKSDRQSKYHSLFVAQLKKEFLALVDNPGTFFSFASPLLFLPVLLLLLSKFYSSMKIDAFGNILALVVSLLISMLVIMNSVTVTSTLYSKEGIAFNLSRTLPVNQKIILPMKLFFPVILVIVSGLSSVLMILFRSNISVASAVLLAIGVVFFGIGQCLFASALDIGFKNDLMSLEENTEKNQNVATFISFAVSFLMAFLYYRFLREDSGFLPELKVFIFGTIFLLATAWNFFHKADVYAKGGI